jgi:hypothetical protein
MAVEGGGSEDMADDPGRTLAQPATVARKLHKAATFKMGGIRFGDVANCCIPVIIREPISTTLFTRK